MKNVIETIRAKTFFDYTKNHASDAEINEVVQKSKVILDPTYLEFLKSINGFELNGLNFYGTKELPDIHVQDVIQQNQFWSTEIHELGDYFIIADGDMDFYCYQPSNRMIGF